MTGVKNYGIISKYNFYRPISEAGEIIYINNEDDKKIHTIPNIESGDDIAESLVIENKVYIISPRHAYFYDFENFKYYYMQNDFYNAISLSNEGLTYTKISEDYLIWCSVKFKER